MRYYVQYQHRPRDRERPLDEGMAIEIQSENGELILLPNVGDYVSIQGNGHIEGVIETKFYRYIHLKDAPTNPACMINIVLGDTDVNWAKLVKE